MDHDFISTLATALNISADELSRQPSADEAREWVFYRTSAKNPQEVWRHASELWAKHGVSDKQAASIIKVKHANLSLALNGKTNDVFQWDHAQRLSAAINIAPPERFLPSEQIDPVDNTSR